jgi:hypothetical protein
LYGFTSARKWNRWFILAPNVNWQPADMTKVKELLESKAKKDYPNGTRLKSTQTGLIGVSTGLFSFTFTSLYTTEYEDREVFDSETGKWAEIVKKPLYTNAYKTEFFEGDEVHYIFSRPNCKPRIAFGYTSDPMEAEGYYSEAMTERECHRYIDEHWDELHK